MKIIVQYKIIRIRCTTSTFLHVTYQVQICRREERYWDFYYGGVGKNDITL